MTGEYGTLIQYIRAYRRYGSSPPPIPGKAAENRGEVRKTKAWIPVSLVKLILAAIPPALLVETTSTSLSSFSGTVAFAVCILGVAWMLTDILGAPILDWYEDVPRRGLPRVDAEYGPTEVLA